MPSNLKTEAVHQMYMTSFLKLSNTVHLHQVFGMMTKPLIRLLLPASSHSVTSEPSSPKSLHSPLLTSMQGSDLETASHSHIVRPSSLRMLLSKPTHTVHYYWRKFDDALMRPMFGGRGFVPFSPGSPTEQSVHGGR